ncbi:MAG: hypothetical protein IJ389_03260 [Clostridia bacterium]|nr:hypothetical protein [Clostridia bacterium]
MAEERNWHYMNSAELEKAFRTGSSGLSEKEAARRTRTRRNRIWVIKGDTVGKYAARSLLDPCAVLLLLSVIVAAFYGEGAVAAATLILMLCAKTVEIFSFTAADTLFKKSTEGVVPKARVVREGNVREIPCEMVAEGDVIILDSGDIVPCDIRLTAAENVLAAENLPGGKHGIYIKDAEPVNSRLTDVPIEMRSNMLYAGSTVIYGFCMGIAVATGKRTLRVSREGTIELSGGENIPVLEKLSEWSRICRLILVAAAFAVTVLGVAFGHGLLNSFLPSVAMASACMSEFLASFGALAVAMSLRSEYKKEGNVPEKTNFRCANKIEAAAHAKVLMLRSADLIKNGVMSLHSFYIDGKKHAPDEQGAAPSLLVAYGAYAAGIGYDGSGGEDSTFISSAYLKELRKKYAEDVPAYYLAQHKSASESEAEGLDCSLLIRDNDYYFAAIGEAANILSRCTKERAGGEPVAFSKDKKADAQRYASLLSRQGVKIIAVASRPSHYNSMRRLPVLLSDMCFEGFIAISQKPESMCEAYIREHRENGGSVVIFSDLGEEDMRFLSAYDIFRQGDIFINEKDSREATSLPIDSGSLIMIDSPAATDEAALRLRYIKMVAEKHRCAYIGFGAEDSICMNVEKTVSFAAESPLKRGSGVPQSLKCAADGAVDSKGGGFCGAMRMIKRFRRTLAQIKSTLRFLICSQIARLFWMLICTVLGLSLPTASQIVLLGCILDMTCALCSLSCIGKRANGEGIRTRAIPDSVGELLIPSIAGTVIAAVSVASPFIYKLVMSMGMREANLTAETVSSLIFCGLLFALPVVFVEMTSVEGLFGKISGISPVLFVPLALSVLILVLSFSFEGFSQAMSLVFPGFIPLAFSLIPLLVSVIFLAAYRAYVNKKYKN